MNPWELFYWVTQGGGAQMYLHLKQYDQWRAKHKGMAQAANAARR